MDRSKVIRDGMARSALRGLVLGRVPFGYEAAGDGSFRIVPKEAIIVRRIFELAAEGKGVRIITKDLNASGAQTRKARPWSMVTIRDMLRNRTYTGTYTRFSSRVTGNHEALVPPSVFARIQRQMDERAKKSGSAKGKPFLLSGLVICGACGSHMIGVTRHRSWTRKNGTHGEQTYRYYQCEGSANQGRCSSRGHSAAELDAVVLTDARTTATSSEGRLRRSVASSLDDAAGNEALMKSLQVEVRKRVETVTVAPDRDMPPEVALKELSA
jgi:hypothetical protein